MAEDKKTAAKGAEDVKAPETPKEAVPVQETQETQEIQETPEVVEADGDGEEFHLLRPGKKHNIIVRGALYELDGDRGEGSKLTPEQFKAFSDKFFSVQEGKEYKIQQEALLKAARDAQEQKAEATDGKK